MAINLGKAAQDLRRRLNLSIREAADEARRLVPSFMQRRKWEGVTVSRDDREVSRRVGDRPLHVRNCVPFDGSQYAAVITQGDKRFGSELEKAHRIAFDDAS